MAHQWYGDQVTPDDWRDVWMNEGMAMYSRGSGRPSAAAGRCAQTCALRRAADQQLRDEYGPPGDYDPRRSASSNIYYSPR